MKHRRWPTHADRPQVATAVMPTLPAIRRTGSNRGHISSLSQSRACKPGEYASLDVWRAAALAHRIDIRALPVEINRVDAQCRRKCGQNHESRNKTLDDASCNRWRNLHRHGQSPWHSVAERYVLTSDTMAWLNKESAFSARFLLYCE